MSEPTDPQAAAASDLDQPQPEPSQPEPAELEPTETPTLSADEVAEARRYSQATLRCTLLDIGLDLIVLSAMAWVVGPAIDRWLGGFALLAEPQSYLRLALLAAAITGLHSLVSLPLSYYSGYVVEHRFGLSNQSYRDWWRGWAKTSGLTLVTLTLLYTGLFAIVWSVGIRWWLVAAPAFFLVSGIIGILLPVVVLPLYYKSTPLGEGEQLERTRRLADGTGLRIDGVFRLDTSVETKKANAMLAGAGATRRVLLGDTLLANFTQDEIDVVVAHEIGHHVFRHLAKLLALSAAVSAVGFYACHLALGAWTGEPNPRAWESVDLPKVTLVLSLFSLAVGPVLNVVSRHFERQADRYAVRATGDRDSFHSAFIKLARMNKADLDPHPLEVFLLHSHPPIRERLALADRAVG